MTDRPQREARWRAFVIAALVTIGFGGCRMVRPIVRKVRGVRVPYQLDIDGVGNLARPDPSVGGRRLGRIIDTVSGDLLRDAFL